MIHPLLRLFATQPHLIGDHVEAYADLVGDELKKTGAAWTMKVALFAVTGVLALLGLIFLGVALMLWGVLPASDYPAGWALIAVPGVTLVGAVIAFFVARSLPIESAFDNVKKQLSADMAVLREASA
jgi:hypothetical protein